MLGFNILTTNETNPSFKLLQKQAHISKKITFNVLRLFTTLKNLFKLHLICHFCNILKRVTYTQINILSKSIWKLFRWAITKKIEELLVFTEVVCRQIWKVDDYFILKYHYSTKLIPYFNKWFNNWWFNSLVILSFWLFICNSTVKYLKRLVIVFC